MSEERKTYEMSDSDIRSAFSQIVTHQDMRAADSDTWQKLYEEFWKCMRTETEGYVEIHTYSQLAGAIKPSVLNKGPVVAASVKPPEPPKVEQIVEVPYQQKQTQQQQQQQQQQPKAEPLEPEQSPKGKSSNRKARQYPVPPISDAISKLRIPRKKPEEEKPSVSAHSTAKVSGPEWEPRRPNYKPAERQPPQVNLLPWTEQEYQQRPRRVQEQQGPTSYKRKGNTEKDGQKKHR